MIICKVLIEDKVYYKYDTFWSLNEDVTYAKTHSLENLTNNGHLIKNFLYVINKSDKKKKYDNVKVGYDIVIDVDNYEIKEFKPGFWIYKLKYDEIKNEIILVDISRLAKLKEIREKTSE